MPDDLAAALAAALGSGPADGSRDGAVGGRWITPPESRDAQPRVEVSISKLSKGSRGVLNSPLPDRTWPSEGSGWRESNPRNQLGRLGLYH